MTFLSSSKLKNKFLRYYKYYIYVILAILLLNVFFFVYDLSQASNKTIKPTASHFKTNTGIYEERKANKIDKNYVNNARRAWNKKYGHIENEVHQGILFELDNLDDYFLWETKSEFIQNKVQNLVNQIGQTRNKDPVTLTESHIKDLNSWLIHHNTNKTVVNQTQPSSKYYMNLISQVSHLLCQARVVHTDLMTKGTQLKLMLTLETNHQTDEKSPVNVHPLAAINYVRHRPRRSQVRVVFKPKWYNNTETFPNIVDGKDRHYGEYIAFFLSLLLEMYTVPVVQLRSFTMHELLSTGSERFNGTLFEKDDQICVKGKCMYCTEENALCCSESGVVQGAVIVYMEQTQIAKVRNPYQRSYNSNKLKPWETSESYCHKQLIYQYDKQFLLDLVDLSVFDYLIQNGDRHHLDKVNLLLKRGDSHLDVRTNEVNIGDKNDPPPSGLSKIDKYLLLDNGKSFGQPGQDSLDVLAPLYQCCVMRSRTYNKLVQLRGGLLTKTLKQLSKHSGCPLSSSESEEVLTEVQWRGLERRLSLIYATVNYCMRKHNGKTILVN
uniref:Glycosaminoglycan xylosylkinase homolog n=1 Tax=Cacopsylla melanoneura TaxID=428564 RepID=A0A8D8MF04_9HEMI